VGVGTLMADGARFCVDTGIVAAAVATHRSVLAAGAAGGGSGGGSVGDGFRLLSLDVGRAALDEDAGRSGGGRGCGCG